MEGPESGAQTAKASRESAVAKVGEERNVKMVKECRGFSLIGQVEGR